MPDTAARLFVERCRENADRPALRVLAAGGAGGDRTLTWEEWGGAARAFAAALVAAGVGPGEPVAILAGNGVEWPVADLGALLAGAVSVGVYPTSAPAQVAEIVADAGAGVVVADAADQVEKVRAVRDRLPRPIRLIGPDGDSSDGVTAWEEWLGAGRDALAGGADDAVRRRTGAVGPEDTAILIYTSGSTGEAKGARISHRCLLASAESVRDTLGLTRDDTALSFLPYSHAAERMFGLHTRILCGMEAGLVADHTRVWEAARAYGPTLFGGLPRFYEKAYEALRGEEEGLDGDEREAWRRTVELGRERSRLRREGREVPEALEGEWREVGRPAFAHLRERFGGRLRLATSGGAALPEEVAEYLDALGCTVLGAYGLTEHLCAAFNRPDRYRFDAAGPAMPGTELRIAEDGEILIRRSALTFSGYHNRPDATTSTFTPDGEWLRTGDLGTLDERGFLRVTGRKKELIALSTGKKLAPLPIETRLAESPWIARAVLHGEGRQYVSALLALRRPVVEAWARERGLEMEWPALLVHPRVRERVEAAVAEVNRDVSRSERVRRFLLLERDLTADAGELTPTLKVRRDVVAERYRERLDALYEAELPDAAATALPAADPPGADPPATDAAAPGGPA